MAPSTLSSTSASIVSMLSMGLHRHPLPLFPALAPAQAKATSVPRIPFLLPSVVVFIASHASYAFATATSFLLFSANYAMHSFSSYFFFYAVNFSTMEMSGAHHSNCHVSSTLKITSSVAIYGSSFHLFVGSWRILR